MARKTSKQPEAVVENASTVEGNRLIEDTRPSMLIEVLELSEGIDKPKKYIARGEFGKCDEPTQNKRVYRKELWEREIKKLQKSLTNRNVYGMLDHPIDGKTSLALTSHIVTHLEIKDGLVIGEAEILDTQQGKNLKALLDAKCKVGVSSRGYGTVKKNAQGHDVVQDDYRLLSWDFVADPADGDAYPEIFLESKQLVLQGADIPLVEEEQSVADSETDKKEPELDTDAADKVAAATEKEPVAPEGVLGASAPVAPKTTETESVSAEEVQYRIHKAVEDTRRETQHRLREEFTRTLVASVNEAKAQLRSEVTAELSQDPAVAGAKLALEQVRNTLLPYVLPEETKGHIKKIESALNLQIESLKSEVSAKNLQIKTMEEKIEWLSTAAKEASYKFYLETACAGDPDAATIKKMVGDVHDYKSAADLKGKVEALKADFAAKRKLTEAAEGDARKSREELARIRRADEELKIEEHKQSAVKALNEQHTLEIKALKEGLEKALEANELLKVRLLSEAKLTNNPKAPKIRAVMESMSLKSEAEADTVIESFREPARSQDELSDLRARISQRINGGSGRASSLEEDAPRARGNSVDSAISGEIGIDVKSALLLAGVNKK